MNFVLLGIQGCGKGTQGRTLVEKYHFRFLEMGARLRELAKREDAYGSFVRENLKQGNLLPNQDIIRIIEEFVLTKPEQPFVLDGAPRMLPQKLLFDQLMRRVDQDFKVLFLNLDPAKALDRINQRRICKKCKATYAPDYTLNTCQKKWGNVICGGELTQRVDDINIKAIQNRIHNFQTLTLPVIELYQQENKLLEINADQSMEAVTQEIEKKIKIYL